MTDRVVRLCDVCGGLDDHPRHVQSVSSDTPGTVPDATFLRKAILDGASDDAVAELMHPETLVRHMDCCAAQGCTTCANVTGASGNKSGDDLLAFIVSGAADATHYDSKEA